MDRHEIQLFLHLAETLHFGKTSQACNVSPSALSRAIKRLEDEAGEQLFERDNRKVALTPAGTLFLDYARTVAEGWKQFTRSLRGGEMLQGELSLFCSVTACYSILPAVLQNFRVSYPNIQLKLQTGDAASAVQQVLDSRVDITVAALPDRLPSCLAFKTITETPLFFIAPGVPCFVSEQVSEESIPWKDVPMILPERGLARTRIDRWFRKKGIHANVYAQVSGNEAILAMVSLGCGVGVVPGLVVEKSPLQANVRILRVKPELAPYTVGVCVQKRNLKAPLVQAFWESVENS